MTPAKTTRRIVTGLAVLACVAAVTVAAVPTAEAGYEEDTSGMFEVKLGPYQPLVDEEFDNGPYREFFGNNSMFYGELAYDVHLWREFGTLSLGFHAGYGRVRGAVVDQEGRDVEAGDTSKLRNLPLRASVVYRYDYSAHNHNVPLVPVAKLGVNYNFWRVADAGGETMEVDGQRGSGGLAGIHGTLGLHLHLDFFDPTGAAALDFSWGVANSFLFAEYSWTRTSVFGSDRINLGANHWSAGLAFEF